MACISQCRAFSEAVAARAVVISSAAASNAARRSWRSARQTPPYGPRAARGHAQRPSSERHEREGDGELSSASFPRVAQAGQFFGRQSSGHARPGPGGRPFQVHAAEAAGGGGLGDGGPAPSPTPLLPPASERPRPPPNPLRELALYAQHLWRQLSSPLGNFGFGKRSIWEGGVGLFLAAGVVLLAITVSWIRGVQVRSKTAKYQAVFEFSQACGITVGTPVRIRGVDVGSVVKVTPSLEKIDVTAEVSDAAIVIPRTSLVEVNQSGLISETLIDITPRPPLPRPRFSALDPGCAEEGLIVCHREHIVGQQGVSLDELVGICTKIAKQMDAQGVHHMFHGVRSVTALIDEYKPILDQVQRMVKDLAPMLADMRHSKLLYHLEGLAKEATEATQDLRSLNAQVLTSENTALLRQSVATLTSTLKHLEVISGGVSVVTGDSGTQYNLKNLIESLSRLVGD